MTVAELPLKGEFNDDARQEPHDLSLWSVTTIIGAIDKPALVQWAAIETAKAAVDHADIVASRLRNEGRDSAIEYLKNARFRRPKGERTAKDLGTAVHGAVEQWALSGIRPDVDAEVAPFVRQFGRFLAEYRPMFVATEVTVYHPEMGYAGTADAFIEIDGRRFIIDYKTSRDTYDGQGKLKGPYPEVALQLAAYRHAPLAAVWRARRFEKFRRRYYLLSPHEREMAVPTPEVEGGLVIYLTPDHYAVHEIDCGPAVYEAFLFVQEAARWSFEQSKNVVGPPMMPPYPIPEPTDDPFAGLPQ